MYLERVVELIILHSRTSPAPGSASASDKAQAKQQQQQQSTASGRLLPHALRSVASDSGLHPLLPYFVHFVADEVCPPAQLGHVIVLCTSGHGVYSALPPW